MSKYRIMRAHIKERHERRIEELGQQLGMNRSEVIRALIENACVVERPVLGATLAVERETGGASLSQATSATSAGV
jgi:hypothetical protein